MIGIRVDANNEIATGHVMRCLSIAFGIKKADKECFFITADENAKEILAPYGFEVICLNSQWNDLNKETEKLVEVIREFNIDKLIIDSYFVTPQYLKRLMIYTKVIYIDDMNFFKYPVSMVINYNSYYEIFLYPVIYANTETELLLGCEFAPLREEFSLVKPLYRNKVKKVLISTGGTDKFNLAGKLLNGIKEKKLFRGIEFHVVVGTLNPNFGYLLNLSDRNVSIVLHKNVKSMSKLMISCDIAITAGGSTMYELCACGIPTICFSFADNQLYGVRKFANDGIMAYAGDIRDSEGRCILNLIDYIEEYIRNANERKKKSVRMRKKVDGNGVKRIVKAIIDLC